MNTALGFSTRLVLAPGSTWPNRCNAFSSAERWRDTISMMWRSSKTGFGTPSRAGIAIPPPLSGEASGMRVATGPTRGGIGREDQGLPPSLCCHDAFDQCAITNGSAMPSHLTSDPLGPILRPLITEPILFNEAIKILINYSLIQRNATTKTLSIHRLVQAVIRNGMEKTKQ